MYKIRKDDVLNSAGLYSPLIQTYLLFLYEKGAKSWPSGRSLRDMLHDGLPSDPIAVHHIFPKKVMQNLDFPIDRLNSAANYAVLSQADNAEIGDRDPFDVWRGLRQNQKDAAAVQLCLVAKDELLKAAAYDDFLDFRSSKMADQINEYLQLA